MTRYLSGIPIFPVGYSGTGTRALGLPVFGGAIPGVSLTAKPPTPAIGPGTGGISITAQGRPVGFIIPAAPPPIGAAPSNYTGRPTTVFEILGYNAGRVGQTLTINPIGYVGSVSSIGTATVGAAAPVAAGNSGGIPLMWLLIGGAALAGLVYVMGRR